jgi:DNA-binding CsgD family transcriptional regulator
MSPGDYPTTQRTEGVPSVPIRQLRAIRAERAEIRRYDGQLQGREDREVLSLFAHHPPQWIAKRLGASRQTVERHVADARKRLGETDPEFVASADATTAGRRLRARVKAGHRLVTANAGMTSEELRACETYESVIEQQSDDDQGWGETVRPDGKRRATRDWRTKPQQPAPVTVRRRPSD